MQTPFATHIVDYGSVIQAEHFDNSFADIQSLAYQDSDIGNSLGTYRAETSVDATETKVGNIADGEWLEYTADVAFNAYNIDFNVSSNVDGGKIRVLAATSNTAGFMTDYGTVDVPNTAGLWQTVTLARVNLSTISSSEALIRLEFIGGGFDLDSMTFEPATQTPYRPRTIAVGNIERIELEEYDVGGPGAAYYDATPRNDADNPFRPDEGVDASNGLVTNHIFAGEWLEYTTDIQPGSYDVTLGKAWSAGETTVTLLAGMENSARTFDTIGSFTFGGEADSLTLPAVDLSPYAGEDRVFRVQMENSYFGIDFLEFASLDPDTIAPEITSIEATANEATIVFNEDVSGLDISDFTLTRDGAAIDISGLSATQVSGEEYTVELSSVTDIDGEYELTLNGVGSGIVDSAGQTLSTDAVDQFMVDRTGPRVESVVINDGSNQRSMVQSLTVTFSEEVSGVDASAFVLMNTTTDTQVIPTVNTELIAGKNGRDADVQWQRNRRRLTCRWKLHANDIGIERFRCGWQST